MNNNSNSQDIIDAIKTSNIDELALYMSNHHRLGKVTPVYYITYNFKYVDSIQFKISDDIIDYLLGFNLNDNDISTCLLSNLSSNGHHYQLTKVLPLVGKNKIISILVGNIKLYSHSCPPSNINEIRKCISIIIDYLRCELKLELGDYIIILNQLSLCVSSSYIISDIVIYIFLDFITNEVINDIDGSFIMQSLAYIALSIDSPDTIKKILLKYVDNPQDLINNTNKLIKPVDYISFLSEDI